MSLRISCACRTKHLFRCTGSEPASRRHLYVCCIIAAWHKSESFLQAALHASGPPGNAIGAMGKIGALCVQEVGPLFTGGKATRDLPPSRPLEKAGLALTTLGSAWLAGKPACSTNRGTRIDENPSTSPYRGRAVRGSAGPWGV